MVHRISVGGIYLVLKTKGICCCCSLWQCRYEKWSLCQYIWSCSSESVIQLRDTSWMTWSWRAAQCGQQQPLVPSLTFFCAALLTQKASLIKSVRSRTTVAIRRLFVYTFVPAVEFVQARSHGVVGHIFTLSSRKEQLLLITTNLSTAACLLYDSLWGNNNSIFLHSISLALLLGSVCVCVCVCVSCLSGYVVCDCVCVVFNFSSVKTQSV